MRRLLEKLETPAGVRLVRLINIVRDLVAGNYRPSRGVGPAVKVRRDAPPSLFIERFANQTEFQSYRARKNAEVAARLQRESELMSPEPRFKSSGFCFVCQEWTEFVSSWDFAYCVDGRLQLNWREQLRCQGCHLNNRMRASVHLLAHVVAPTKKSRIYATEQSTPLYRYLRKCFPLLAGSEYLEDGTALGQTNSAGLRSEGFNATFVSRCIFRCAANFRRLRAHCRLPCSVCRVCSSVKT
jgi:hypothetical protein